MARTHRLIRPKNDVVYTRHAFARRLVRYFQPAGFCLDPCRGGGAFYNALPEPKAWCEITEGRDFLDWTHPVDWIITNPPWSAELYRSLSRHAFEIAENVVFLVRLHDAIGTWGRNDDFRMRGHALKEILMVDWNEAGFVDEGFILAAFHWQRNYRGGTRWNSLWPLAPMMERAVLKPRQKTRVYYNSPGERGSGTRYASPNK